MINLFDDELNADGEHCFGQELGAELWSGLAIQAAWVALANTGHAELLSRRAGHLTLDADGEPQIDQLWVR